MRAVAAEITQIVESGARQMVDGLRKAASEGITVRELTNMLQCAFIGKNQVDYALSVAIDALRQATEKSPDDVLTLGRGATAWLTETLNISRNAAYAQLKLAEQLPSLPATAAAFERGQLSAQHAGVISQTVASVHRGGGDVASERWTAASCRCAAACGLISR